MGISRTVSETDGDFIQKLPVFPPRVFYATTDGVPLGIVHGTRGRKARMMALSGGRKTVHIDFAV